MFCLKQSTSEIQAYWKVEGLDFNFNGLYLSNGESLISSWRASITRESPRWLVLKGKLKDAEVVLNRIAEVNGKEMPEDKVQSEPEKQIRMGDLRDLFSSKKMAHKSLLSWYLWYVLNKLVNVVTIGLMMFFMLCQTLTSNM